MIKQINLPVLVDPMEIMFLVKIINIVNSAFVCVTSNLVVEFVTSS